MKSRLSTETFQFDLENGKSTPVTINVKKMEPVQRRMKQPRFFRFGIPDRTVHVPAELKALLASHQHSATNEPLLNFRFSSTAFIWFLLYITAMILSFQLRSSTIHHESSGEISFQPIIKSSVLQSLQHQIQNGAENNAEW